MLCLLFRTGFQRRDFNDVYRLNIPTMAWELIEIPAGAAVPAPRSGHVAVANRSTMLVHGGWSSTALFNDLWSFDTENLCWSRVDEVTPGPFRWNHAAICIPAVPNWQMFVFGGSMSAADGQDAKVAVSGII